MPSRWKRVDLLSLSSVTSTAAAKRRTGTGVTALLTTAGSLASTPETSVCNAATRTDAYLEGEKTFGGSATVHSRNSDFIVENIEQHHLDCSSSSKSQPAAAATTTCVSISRLLSRLSLTWQASLACFVELAENPDRGTGGKKRLNEANDNNAVPLEAILLQYATLRRAANKNTPQTNSQAHGGRQDDDTQNAECAQQPSSAFNNSDNSTVESLPSSSVDAILPLRFLAYASRQHTALKPIRCILASSFEVSGGTLLYPADHSVTDSGLPRGGFLQNRSLPRAVAEELTRLFSVSTVLHVGLGKVLQETTNTLPPSLPQSLRRQQPPPQKRQRQCWAALRTIHHLERYGGARDYLDGLNEGLTDRETRVGFAAQKVHLLTVLSRLRGTSCLNSAKEWCTPIEQPQRANSHSTTEQHHHRLSSVHRVKNSTEAHQLEEVIEVLSVAAHQQPDFTAVFCTLQQAWETHNTRHLAASVSKEWMPTMDDIGATEGGAAVTYTEQISKSDVVVAHNESLNDRTLVTSSPVVDAASNPENVAFAKVRVLAKSEFSPALSLSRNAESDGEMDGTSMSTTELTWLTMDVVHFAWCAITVISNRRSFLTDFSVSSPTFEAAQGSAETFSQSRKIEGETLLQLIYTATRFISFAGVCTWMERLLPSSAQGAKASGVLKSRVVMNNIEGALTTHQRAALLCLLTRAVRRAPSWLAVCTTLQKVWPRISAAVAEDTNDGTVCTAAPEEDEQTSVKCGAGFASCREVLEAFFSSPHSPARRLHTGDELAFWCAVVCTPKRSADEKKEINKSQLQPPASAESVGRASSAREEEGLNSHEWVQLLYGYTPRKLKVSLRCVKERHTAVTAAATRLVQEWLQPAAEHTKMLDVLAACHAECAESWAAIPMSGLLTSDLTLLAPFGEVEGLPEASCFSTMERVAVRYLSDQHRVFSSLFLTSEGAFDWLSAVLSRTQSGAARQLVLLAAWTVRWSSADNAVFPLSQRTNTNAAKNTVTTTHHSDSASVPSSAAPATRMVEDLTRIIQRWVDVSSTVTKTITTDIPVILLRSGEEKVTPLLSTESASYRSKEGRLSDVSLLVNDVVSAFRAHFLPPTSDVASIWTEAVDRLLPVVRRAVTKAGLQWEHQMGRRHAPLHDTSAVKMQFLFDTATRAGVQQPLSASVDGAAAGRTVKSLAHDQQVIIACLHEWLDFLCVCPPLLLADEQHTVVWLYFLMRQVEEMHVWAEETRKEDEVMKSNPEVRVAPMQTLGGLTCVAEASLRISVKDNEVLPTSRKAWWSQMEEVIVRRAVQALSRLLCSSLGPSSLIPPMLLNWLLTRGGMYNWGEAVRFLRTAAATNASSRMNKSEAASGKGRVADEIDNDEQQRYLLLILPLDRVVSVTHAMRVLRTLQVVAEHCRAVEQGPVEEAGLWQCTRTRTEAHSSPIDGAHKAEEVQQTQKWFLTQSGGSLSSLSMSLHRERSTNPTVPSKFKPERYGADITAADFLVLRYYREIERVLLREWYSRAVAAVLGFLVEHPHHTFLTYAVDAPEHAALALRARFRAKQMDGKQNRSADQEARSSALPTAQLRGQSHFILNDTEDASLSEWQTWTRSLRKLPSCEGNGRAISAEPVAAAPHRGGRLQATYSTWSAGCAAVNTMEMLYDAAAGMESVSRNEVRESAAPPMPSTRLTKPAAAAVAAATQPFRVPLHFIGALILQECRIGVLAASPDEQRQARQAELSVVTKLAIHASDAAAEHPTTDSQNADENNGQLRMRMSHRFRRRLPTPRSFGTLVDINTQYLPSTQVEDKEVSQTFSLFGSACSSDRRRPRPVHPELLELFRQVLEVKRAELASGQVAGNQPHETVEDVVCEILDHDEEFLRQQ